MTRILPEAFDFDGQFPRQTRPLRLGIVGGGRISGMQATAARLTNRWQVVAGALSSDPAKALERGAEWYIAAERSYGSLTEMAEAEAAREDGVDAVMVTTPNHVHFDAAQAFVDQGISVLCDKPLTNDPDEADQLVEMAEDKDVIFAVGYVMSCFPMVRQARDIVAEGGIGTINQIHAEFLQDWMIPPDSGDADHVKWRLDPAKSGKSSCTADIGTHAAHLAEFVTGLTLTDLRAELHVCGSPKPLEDTVFMFTRYDSTVPGTLMATRLAPGNRGGLRLRIFGSEGGLEWDLEDAERLKWNRFGEPDRVLSRGHGHGLSAKTERLVRTARGFPEGIIEAWANLYTEFALAVAARADSLTPPTDWLDYPTVADGARGVAFVEAAVASSEKQDWVTI